MKSRQILVSVISKPQQMKLYLKQQAPASWTFHFSSWVTRKTKPKNFWEEERGKCFQKTLFPWHQKCLWRGWEVPHSQTTAGTVGESESSLLWPVMCFSPGEGMKALGKCCGISVSPQNVPEVPAENMVFEACEGAEGSVPFSLCYPHSRAAAALLPLGVPRGCQRAWVAQGSKFCCRCSSVSGPLCLTREGVGNSFLCNGSSVCLITFCSFSKSWRKSLVTAVIMQCCESQQCIHGGQTCPVSALQ